MEYAPLYTVKEASRILKISVADTYNLMNIGKLPYLILGSKKVRGSDLERFIENYPTAEVMKREDSNSV